MVQAGLNRGEKDDFSKKVDVTGSQQLGGVKQYRTNA